MTAREKFQIGCGIVTGTARALTEMAELVTALKVRTDSEGMSVEPHTDSTVVVRTRQ